MPDRQAEAIAAATELSRNIKCLSDDTVKLRTTGKRQRRLIRILAVSVALDFLLSFCIAFVAYVSLSARSDAGVSRVAQYETCLSANRTRAVQFNLWNTVFDTIGEDRLPEVTELKVLVAQTFSPRSCVAP